MGFYDIHFTHGGVEFVKDFIAKKSEDGIEYQYAVQSKKGDINQGLWRNKIRGQLEDAILTDLSHPQFSTNLPRKAILVTTGRLVGNARLAAQEFKTKLEAENKAHELLFWEREQLAQLSEQYGFEGIHQTAQALTGFGQFYLTYSKAIEGTLSDREIEEFSRLWLDEIDYRKRILRGALEAGIIGAKLVEAGRYHEAIAAYSGLARLVMHASYETEEPFVIEIMEEVLNRKILPLCKLFFQQFKSEWHEAERDLIRLCLPRTSFPIAHYLVWCARVIETAGLYFFLTKDNTEREEIASFLLDFIQKEEGVGHIPSDRYAVSLVWPTLALIQLGKSTEALDLVKRSAIWLCDRLEKGWGIAPFEADEKEETQTLLGYPFDFIQGNKRRGSYLATVLADLAAFIGDEQFYGDVVNDFEACEIAYTYWQFPDTDAVFTIDTEGVVSYPNIPHQYSIDNFEDFNYSEHIKHEPEAFRIAEKVGVRSLVLLSAFLKDRYFPKVWSRIVSDGEQLKAKEAACG